MGILLTKYKQRENTEADSINMSAFRKYKEIIYSCMAVALLYGLFDLLGIGCPIKLLTGISCAGCGMTRAWAAVLQLDFAGAFSFHPLWWTIPPALCIFLIGGRLRKKTLNICLFIFVMAFIIVYLYRMLAGGQDIVVFEPQNGLIWRTVHHAAYILRLW